MKQLLDDIEEGFASLRTHLNGHMPEVRNAVQQYRAKLVEVIRELEALEEEVGHTRRLATDLERFEVAINSLRDALKGDTIKKGLMTEISSIGDKVPTGVAGGGGQDLGNVLDTLKNVGQSEHAIPSQQQMNRLFKEHITVPSKAAQRQLEGKLEALQDKFSELPGQVSEIIENGFKGIAEELGNEIGSLKESVEGKIELGAELSGMLDEEITSVVIEVREAVSEIDDTFQELSEVWESANDDMPESGGALNDAIVGFEAAQEAIENVYQ